MELYIQNGVKAGLFDVIDWWVENYPEDKFPAGNGQLVAQVREHMLSIARGMVREMVDEMQGAKLNEQAN